VWSCSASRPGRPCQSTYSQRRRAHASESDSAQGRNIKIKPKCAVPGLSRSNVFQAEPGLERGVHNPLWPFPPHHPYSCSSDSDSPCANDAWRFSTLLSASVATEVFGTLWRLLHRINPCFFIFFFHCFLAALAFLVPVKNVCRLSSASVTFWATDIFRGKGSGARRSIESIIATDSLQ